MTTAHDLTSPRGRLLGDALHLVGLAFVRSARILALPVPRLHPGVFKEAADTGAPLAGRLSDIRPRN
jgi:hypothetical protein